MKNQNQSAAEIYLKDKIEVAKYIKYIITDLLNGVSQGNMFVYNGEVYTVLITD